MYIDVHIYIYISMKLCTCTPTCASRTNNFRLAPPKAPMALSSIP